MDIGKILFINNSKDKNSYIHGISNSHIFNGTKYLMIEDKLTFFDTIIKNKKLVFNLLLSFNII